MASWVRDEADYKFNQPGNTEDTKVHVTGLADLTESERPKLLIESHWDNHGLSVEESPQARDQCIQSLSASMKIAPQEADWYTRDQDGQLQSVSIGYESVQKENPMYAALERSGDLNHKEIADAKTSFPDIFVNELRTSVQPADQGQQKELAEAFSHAYSARPAEMENTNVQASVQQPSAHEYNLSQESFHEH